MSRFSLEPPDDETPRVRCCERFCEHWIDVPEREVFCYACRLKHQAQIADCEREVNATQPAMAPGILSREQRAARNLA